jgi:hypothetical protein
VQVPGHEDAGQVTEVQRTDEQPRHDLVAHPEQQRAVVHVVGEGHRGTHRDRVAREEAQLHPRLALRDAVAHRGHAAGHLRGGTVAASLVADHGRKALVGLVRRQHVVVGRDDGDVGGAFRHHAQLVAGRQRGPGVGEVRAARAIHGTAARRHRSRALEVGAARVGAAGANAFGDGGDGGVQGHGAGRPGEAGGGM